MDISFTSFISYRDIITENIDLLTDAFLSDLPIPDELHNLNLEAYKPGDHLIVRILSCLDIEE